MFRLFYIPRNKAGYDSSILHSAEGRKADILMEDVNLRKPDVTQQLQLEQPRP